MSRTRAALAIIRGMVEALDVVDQIGLALWLTATVEANLVVMMLASRGAALYAVVTACIFWLVAVNELVEVIRIGSERFAEELKRAQRGEEEA